MKKSRLKMIRQSIILHKGKPTRIDVYQCIDSKKFLIINAENDTRIRLDGALGEEID